MSEHLAAEIFIGGTLSRKHVHRLCGLITAAGVELDWDGGAFEPRSGTELLKQRIERDGALVLTLRDSATSWGRFDELEAFLVQRHLPFDRYTEGKYEYDPEWAYYRRGSQPRSLRTTATREPTVLSADLIPVIEQVTKHILLQADSKKIVTLKSLQSALRRLRKLAPFLPAPLPAFEIAD